MTVVRVAAVERAVEQRRLLADDAHRDRQPAAQREVDRDLAHPAGKRRVEARQRRVRRVVVERVGIEAKGGRHHGGSVAFPALGARAGHRIVTGRARPFSIQRFGAASSIHSCAGSFLNAHARLGPAITFR
ncbi:hypothetical protein BCEP4_1180028 [Burkholderia cepacia]|nr:hypothetical protein BCEP4_1180028 [Burkholderia cepacia]